MNSLVLVGYYMVKEAVKPRLHHSDFEEYLEDVDLDCFRHTHNFKHMKHVHFVNKQHQKYIKFTQKQRAKWDKFLRELKEDY